MPTPGTDARRHPDLVCPPAPRPSGSSVELGVLGARVRVTGGTAAVAGLAERWSRCVPGAGAPDAPEVSLPLSDLPLSAEMELRLTERVTLAGIDHAAGDHVLLHAAGLAADDGSVVGLVAPSGTGKSTAAIHLATHGWGYVTDETLAVGADLTVRAWPKPLALVDPSGGHKRLHGPDELGLAAAPDALRLGRLVVLHRDACAARATLHRVEDDQAIALLVGQSSALVRLDHPLRRLESLLAAVGGLWRLDYAEIEEAAPLLQGLLAPDSAPAPRSGPLAPRVFASPVRDVLAVGGGLAVLTGDRLVHVTGVGAEVLQAAYGGVARDALVAEVVGRIGPHPAARELVAAAVDELVGRGLLEVEGPVGRQF